MSVTTGAPPQKAGVLDRALARSFVSHFLARRLASQPALSGPESYPGYGAVLLSDIEAFTAHVERLAQEGPAGLEQVVDGFNRYFATVADAVGEQGGDILTIAGDSFLCWWPAKSEAELGQAAVRAAQAALTIQSRVAESQSGGLRTRIGLAAGEAVLGIAGGVGGRWELVPAGPAVLEVAGLEADARPGTVRVGPGAVRELADLAELRDPGADGAELVALRESIPPAGAAARPEEIPPEQLLQPVVPAPVRRWGRADQALLADFRHVTVVMTRLAGLGPTKASDLERLQNGVEAFQRVISRFDGAHKVHFDNKGLTCSAVFGLPPRAHYDDIDRALRASQAIDEALGELDLRSAIGISSGRVCCGVFGNDERREYSLFGDAVNVAARLSVNEVPEVLIDNAVAETASLALEVERRPLLALKNRVEPVRVHRLLALRVARAPERTVVGRERERAVVLEAIEQLLTNGEATTLVIEGELGIGKSTLAGEALEAARHRSLKTFTAIAESVERGTAYHPWRPLFSALLAEARSVQELMAIVGRGPEDLELLPLLNPFLSKRLPESTTTAELRGEARSDQVHALLARVLAAQTSQAPALLLVEDSQWLDSMSWALLRTLTQSVPRLLTVVTQRIAELDQELPGECGELRADARTTVMRLGPLSTDETAALVRQRLRSTEISPEILSLVLSRVTGHPFFCEALLEMMIQSGAIHVTGAGAQLGEGAEVGVPASIESAVLSRLDRLEANQQLALKAAAVVGRTFSAEEVAATHPTADGDAVSDQLEVLRALELLSLEQCDPPLGYAFRHQIIQDVAYGLLTDAQKRPMHEALARWYEERASAGHRAAGPQLLAHHWARAARPELAAPYLEQAGHRALHHGGFAEAARLFEDAIAIQPQTPPAHRALLEKSLADAHYFLGDLPRSRALLEQVLERLGHPIPAGRLELARALNRAIVEQVLHLARPRRYLASRARERQALLSAADAARTLVQISYLHAASSIELAYLAITGLNLAELAGPSAELARALANAAVLADLCGMRARGDRYAERAADLARQEEHARAGAYVSNVASIMYAGRGAWGQATQANDRALELFGSVGDYNLESEIWQTRAAIELCRGALREASAAWQRTRELARRTGSRVVLCWSLLDEAQTALARGEVGPGAGALAQALEIPIVDSDRGTVIERRATAALTRLREGQHAEAAAHANSVIDLLSNTIPSEWVVAEFGALAIEVLLELREENTIPAAGLDRRIRRGLNVLRRLTITFRGMRARMLLLRARAVLLSGDRQAAERLLGQAEAACGGPDQEFDRARVAIVKAQLSADPARRKEILEEPLRVLAALDQRHELTRAEALLG